MSIYTTAEFYWLVLTILMTSLLWVPYIVNRMLEQGILAALWDPYGETGTQRPWAQRMMQAHQNAVENLVVFAPLVILVLVTNNMSGITATSCMLYFFARAIHFLAFTFAIPLLRVLTFLLGFAAQLVLALVLLQIL